MFLGAIGQKMSGAADGLGVWRSFGLSLVVCEAFAGINVTVDLLFDFLASLGVNVGSVGLGHFSFWEYLGTEQATEK